MLGELEVAAGCNCLVLRLCTTLAEYRLYLLLS